MFLIQWLCSTARPHLRRLGERPGMSLQMTEWYVFAAVVWRQQRPVQLSCFRLWETPTHTQTHTHTWEEERGLRNLERWKYCSMAATGRLTVCHLSSCAHVQKGGGLEKESLSPNQTQRNGGYLVSSLKRWKSTSVPSTELAIVRRFTKVALPKIEFKAASPDWVTMYLRRPCQLFNCVSCRCRAQTKPAV